MCIFPEGTSHDRTDFIKLKAGVSFMALGAMAEYNSKPVKIVPIGLNYFNREKFRSEVIVDIGKPFEVPNEWVEEFKTNKRETSEKLLNEVEQRMKAVTLTADSFIDFRTMLILRHMYVPKNIVLSPTQHSELCKRFAKGYKKMKEIPECESLSRKAIDYTIQLEEIAFHDKEVRDITFEKKKMQSKLILSTLMFFVVFFCLLPGILMLIPFIVFVKSKTEKERAAVSSNL